MQTFSAIVHRSPCIIQKNISHCLLLSLQHPYLLIRCLSLLPQHPNHLSIFSHCPSKVQVFTDNIYHLPGCKPSQSLFMIAPAASRSSQPLIIIYPSSIQTFSTIVYYCPSNIQAFSGVGYYLPDENNFSN